MQPPPEQPLPTKPRLRLEVLGGGAEDGGSGPGDGARDGGSGPEEEGARDGGSGPEDGARVKKPAARAAKPKAAPPR